MSDPEKREYPRRLEAELLNALGKFNSLASSQDEIAALDLNQIAAWLLANRWHLFPDELKNDIIHRALARDLRDELYYWIYCMRPPAKRVNSSPHDDDCPF